MEKPIDLVEKKVPEKIKLTPKELVFKYLVYLPFFIVSIVTCIAVAFVHLRYQVPYYNSSVAMIINTDKSTRGSNSADALDEIVVFRSKTNVANEIEILRSATLMERVVKALGLNTQLITEGNFKRTETYGNAPFQYRRIFQKDSSSPYTISLKFNEKKHFQVSGMGTRWFRAGELIDYPTERFIIVNIPAAVNPEYNYIIQWQPPFVTASGLAGGLNVQQPNPQASILRISLTTTIPQKGLDILNELVKAYNISTIENKNKVVDNTIKFIDGRLVLLTNELGKVEQGLQEFRQKNEIINIERQSESQFDNLHTLEQKLNDEEVRLQVINMIYTYLNNGARRYNLVPSALGIEDQTLGSLISSYNLLILDREEKLKTMPRENPVIQVLESQIEKVRSNIIEGLSNIRQSAQSLRNSSYREYATLKGELQNIPATQRELLEIERQQGIKEKLYLFLLQKREESAIAVASSTSNSYSIDPAVTSWTPVSPDRTSAFRLAFIIGILIPVIYIYIKDLLNDKVTLRSDIVGRSDVPIIGEVAHHKMADREVVISGRDRSVIAEQFRVSRTNLQYFITNKDAPVILVTSSMAGEGKTFTSMNLGAVWAVASKKTVILELDLRKPKISRALGFSSRKGITDYILGNVDKENLPVLVKGTDNLFIVPAGQIPPNPSELLLTPQMDELFTYLKEVFEIVIIDTGPVGQVSDARVLSRFADATVYIVRQRYTPKKQVEFINELFVRNIFPGMCMIVNDVKLTGANSYYGYGYSYGYGYGYGFNYNLSYNYSYSEDDKKKSIFKRIISFFS